VSVIASNSPVAARHKVLARWRQTKFHRAPESRRDRPRNEERQGPFGRYAAFRGVVDLAIRSVFGSITLNTCAARLRGKDS